MRLKVAVVTFLISILIAGPAAADDGDNVSVGTGMTDGNANVRAGRNHHHGAENAKPIVRHYSAAPTTTTTIPTAYQPYEICYTAPGYAPPDVEKCQPLDPTTATPAQARQQAAQQYASDYFKSLDMPVPAPKVSAPNGGITGAVHSLDLQLPDDVIYTDPQTDFGPLIMHVNAVFTVTWGDGTSNKYYDSGDSWPNSDITHSWTTTGRYNIVVNAQWFATWSFGDVSGVLTGLNTTGAIANWPVLEAQAVITD